MPVLNVTSLLLTSIANSSVTTNGSNSNNNNNNYNTNNTASNATIASNTTTDVLQVVCAFPVSGQYGPGSRILYYVLIAACVFARKAEWLRNACLAAALLFPAVAAIHGIVLAVINVPGMLILMLMLMLMLMLILTSCFPSGPVPICYHVPSISNRNSLLTVVFI